MTRRQFVVQCVAALIALIVLAPFIVYWETLGTETEVV